MAGKKPFQLKIQGKIFTAVVLKVDETDPHGRPLKCSLMYEDDSVETEEGMTFEVVYMRKKATQKVPIN